MALSFSSCDKEIICNCNCQCGNSNQNSERPDNGGSSRPDNGGQNDGNTGNGGGGNTVDRSEYTTYDNTFTKGYAGYCGQWYEDQPANTTNWYIELADNNYDLEAYEGTGFNVVLEFFASGTSSTSIPAGKYTVEQFDKSAYSAGSLLYGYIAEDETLGEVPAGTWLYEGNDGVAAATAGELTVSVSGGTYTLKYTLYDDEYEVKFSGSYTGELNFYDATQTSSAVQATKSSRPTKHLKVRR